MMIYENLRQMEIISPDSPRYKMLGLDKNEKYQKQVAMRTDKNYLLNKAIQEIHEETLRQYEERQAMIRAKEEEKKFRKQLEEKILQQVKETTEKEIRQVFK